MKTTTLVYLHRLPKTNTPCRKIVVTVTTSEAAGTTADCIARNAAIEDYVRTNLPGEPSEWIVTVGEEVDALLTAESARMI